MKPRGPVKKAHLRRYGALGRPPNAQRVRLVCGRRAPTCIWTFSSGRLVSDIGGAARPPALC